MLDKKHRVFSSGFNRFGRLGLNDEKDRIKPTYVKSLQKEKVIEVVCGHFHSVAVTKEGQLYSWGYGNLGRLGQGYDEMKRTNLNCCTP